MKKAKSLISLFLLFVLMPLSAWAEDTVKASSGAVIVVYGDSRTGHKAHREVVETILKVNPEIVFHTGDLVDNGNNAGQWDIFNSITKNLRKTAKFYPSPGNHENNSRLYYDNFELPNNERWYSVKAEDIHFIILDTNASLSEKSEQLKWFKRELKKSKSKFKILIFHHTVYSTGSHGDEKHLQRKLVPILEKHNIDAVFSGHNHIYERSQVNGIYYIVTGGGGAPLHSKSRESKHSLLFVKKYHFCKLQRIKDKFTVTVYDIKMNKIDSFSLPPEN